MRERPVTTATGDALHGFGESDEGLNYLGSGTGGSLRPDNLGGSGQGPTAGPSFGAGAGDDISGFFERECAMVLSRA